MISVYFDNCALDLVFHREWDLSAVLPIGDFELYITPETLIELRAMGDVKAEKRNYILNALASRNVKVDRPFGFVGPSSTEVEAERIGGFDEGRFLTKEEIDFVDAHAPPPLAKIRPRTNLKVGEADLYVAARALHSVVLTFDNEKGALKIARENGATVINLGEFVRQNLSLAEFIREKIDFPTR